MASSVKGDVDSQAAKQVIANVNFKTIIDDELVHDPSTCDTANTIDGVEYQGIAYRLHQHWLRR